MPEDAVKCLQRRQNGEVLITFKTEKLKETFVRQSTLTVDDETFAIQDVDRPLVYVTIFDAPHEMSDLILIERISEYCEVISSRRGRFSFRQNVFNGLRHFRVRLLRPIPSFLRFGRLQVRVKYDGQKPTCRKCGETDHFASACNLTVCFNCEKLGHEMGQCPRRKRCCICRQEGHIGKYCQLSWARDAIVTETTDETTDVIVDSQSEDSLAAEELALGAAIADRFSVEDAGVAGDQSFEEISNASDNCSVISSVDPTPVFESIPELEVINDIAVIPDPVLSQQQHVMSSQNTEITSQKDIFTPTPPSGRRPAVLTNVTKIPTRIPTAPVSITSRSKQQHEHTSEIEDSESPMEQQPADLKRKAPSGTKKKHHKKGKKK